jgi:hypothetical protein
MNRQGKITGPALVIITGRIYTPHTPAHPLCGSSDMHRGREMQIIVQSLYQL